MGLWVWALPLDELVSSPLKVLRWMLGWFEQCIPLFPRPSRSPSTPRASLPKDHLKVEMKMLQSWKESWAIIISRNPIMCYYWEKKMNFSRDERKKTELGVHFWIGKFFIEKPFNVLKEKKKIIVMPTIKSVRRLELGRIVCIFGRQDFRQQLIKRVAGSSRFQKEISKFSHLQRLLDFTDLSKNESSRVQC